MKRFVFPLSGIRKEAGVWRAIADFADTRHRYLSDNRAHTGAPSGSYVNFFRHNEAEDAATTINSVYGKQGRGVYWNNPKKATIKPSILPPYANPVENIRIRTSPLLKYYEDKKRQRDRMI